MFSCKRDQSLGRVSEDRLKLCTQRKIPPTSGSFALYGIGSDDSSNTIDTQLVRVALLAGAWIEIISNREDRILIPFADAALQNSCPGW